MVIEPGERQRHIDTGSTDPAGERANRTAERHVSARSRRRDESAVTLIARGPDLLPGKARAAGARHRQAGQRRSRAEVFPKRHRAGRGGDAQVHR